MATHVNTKPTTHERGRLDLAFQLLLDAWPLTPLRIALIYAVFGFAALYASDVLMVRYVSEPLLSQLQAVKGAGEVIVTAAVIFVLSRGYQAQLSGVHGRLARQREELQVLHRVLRHNLRNNLNKILGYADIIDSRNGYVEECGQIRRAGDQLAHYIEQASRINRVTRRDAHATFDAATLVPRLVRENEAVTDGVEVEIDVPVSAPVAANHMFPEAVDELITNAVTHNDSDTPRVSIVVEAGRRPLMTAISVGDNGPGIPDSELVPLRKRREDPLSHASGMGLWFIDWTVEHSNGEFNLHRTDEGGTTADVLIPTDVDGMEALTSGAFWRV